MARLRRANCPVCNLRRLALESSSTTIMSDSITRRNFIKAASATLGGTAIAASVLSPFGWTAATAEAAETDGASAKNEKPRYRAVSWWLTWEDLTWPNPELMDKIRRRADHCAASGVNCCVIFGAHFRWDFMPLWGCLHDELRFIADELHQRKILLFDHHSSMLTHRPRNREEALNIWERNRHHVPFYPSREEAAVRQFNGSLVNDWRMLDVKTIHMRINKATLVSRKPCRERIFVLSAVF